MARTALVTGATGLLGRQIVQAFRSAGWDVSGTGFTRASPPSTLKLDLNSRDEIHQVLNEVNPQVIIHSAANRFPDKCSADPAGARALNIEASRTLAQAAQARSILLIYISTDYVFPGTPGDAPYEADAPTGPPNLYGQTKLDGERAVLSEMAPSGLGVVMRVPVLYGDAVEPQESAVNVLMDVVHDAQQKHQQQQQQGGAGAEIISMDDWSIRYPTNTEDVARVVQDVAAKYLDAAGGGGGKDDQKVAVLGALPKILQFSSEDSYTKYEICKLFAEEILGLPLDGITPDKEGGNVPGAKVQRPYDCHLSTRALRELGVDVQTMNFKDWW
ncbi:MAG: hypothetical protein M1837_004198 [Sclerophora amabilis]|nr:MAG: hypothetical protein M1837_004198 [Sclerophora amabilis]